MSKISLLIFLYVVECSFGHDSRTVCAYIQPAGSAREDQSQVSDQQVDSANSQVTCNRGTSCYAFCRVSTLPDNSTRITVVNRGCWKGDGCTSNVCRLLPAKNFESAGFCCCTGYLCNLNISSTTILQEHNRIEVNLHRNLTKLATGSDDQTKALMLSGCGVVLILLLLMSVLCKWGPNIQDKELMGHPSQISSSSANSSSSYSAYCSSQLTYDRIVGQGRYGTVWLAYLKGKPVAVKMFPGHYQQYFYNEKDIYTLPFMDHDFLLKLYGDDKIKNKEGLTNYILVLSYCPMGTLQEYLKANAVDLPTFTKMALSVSSALAFLHTEISRQGTRKPCVTHRDINTRNIFVGENLSCSLGDLSLAVKIAGSHYYALGDELHAETKSINDVGTLRYMAPEVLEGAVNLRDCESSLKQIDVYALGLVLWELSMRVTDFFNRPSDVPQYAMPFEKEVGLHPTFEDMQVIICRNKVRPLFPAEWKNNNATKIIRETIEDCTDQDGEARLTALCVHERINQIQRGCSSGSGISPTLNQTNFSGSAFSSSYCYNNQIVATTPSGSSQVVDKGTLDGASDDTVETIVTLSPSDSYSVHLSSISKEVTVIHPHQGRNPCLERNLLSCDSQKDLLIVKTSAKHLAVNRTGESMGGPDTRQRGNPSQLLPPPVSIPILQNRPFAAPKLVNLLPRERGEANIVSSLLKMVKKRRSAEEETALTNVIVSPFDGETSPLRPSSLTLISSDEADQQKCSELLPSNDEAFGRDGRLKELAGRIRTPGDVPPSVRRKRGSRARLSLYDDRMMSPYHTIDSNF